ncbi:MAG: MG2 domain-containing protein [Kiritimatiellaeota bacterium]|nr:MG2 domain-containing protein [Kiritimatiellota bacterium]
MSDDETIARLATGIKRFALPEDYNFMRHYAKTQDNAPSHLAEQYANRRQFEKAAAVWRDMVAKQPSVSWYRDRLDAIVAPQVRMEATRMQGVAGNAVFEITYRNATNVAFSVRALDVEAMIGDFQKLVESNPEEIPWWKQNLSFEQWMTEGNGAEYLGEEVVAWEQAVVPREGHLNRREEIAVPQRLKAGAYLVTAKVCSNGFQPLSENGDNGKDAVATFARCILWVADMAVVQKATQGDNRQLFVAVDAESGEAIEGAELAFFSWATWRHYEEGAERKIDFLSRRTSAVTGKDGCVVVEQPSYFVVTNASGSVSNYGVQTMYVARTQDGRFAFSERNYWSRWYGDNRSAQIKCYLMTDRPVYRPKDTVQFKVWVAEARYSDQWSVVSGQNEESPWAGKKVRVTVNNPNGEKVLEQEYEADRFGGVNGELALPEDAALGRYQVWVWTHGDGYGMNIAGSFRVEEYKKPEFEVAVEAGARPVALGEAVEAVVRATYTFGAPVAEGKAKIKVMRVQREAQWWPSCRWDWLYGRGYCWYGYDYDWYPGWGRWGLCRPYASWWGYRATPPPETVLEVEQALDADGTVKVKIDTSLAKEMWGAKDQTYTITAEVTDASRRTITGSGSVIAAAAAFKTFAWTDRTAYRAGDAVRGRVRTVTADGKIVTGSATLILYRISYGKSDTEFGISETAVEEWSLAVGESGEAAQTFRVKDRGQYRLACTVTDAEGRTAEGAQLFTVFGGDADDGRDYRFAPLELVPDKEEYAVGDTVKLRINADMADAAIMLFVKPSGNAVRGAPQWVRLDGKSAIVEIPVEAKDQPNFFVEAVTVRGGQYYAEVREIVVPPEKKIINVKVEMASPVRDEILVETADNDIESRRDDTDSCHPYGIQSPHQPFSTNMPPLTGLGDCENTFLPGAEVEARVTLTDGEGKPVEGSVVLTVYDKAVEYISGGSNVPEIRQFFWGWRQRYTPSKTHTLGRVGQPYYLKGEKRMETIGVFGDVEFLGNDVGLIAYPGVPAMPQSRSEKAAPMRASGMVAMDAYIAGGETLVERQEVPDMDASYRREKMEQGFFESAGDSVAVRTSFADTAFWSANVGQCSTGSSACAQCTVCAQAEEPVLHYCAAFTMPEDITGWKVRAWAIGDGVIVGEGTTEIVTKKNLMLRMQAPRFFTQKDEVVLSANVHNYLKTEKEVRVGLSLAEAQRREEVEIIAGDWVQTVVIPAGGETRVDWRIKVLQSGMLTVRMTAVTDEESDGMEKSFPVQVHGMLKTESWSGIINTEDTERASRLTQSGTIKFVVPGERIREQTRLEVRYAPTLAGTMLEALPYLLDYPYGCTEQTLNRFLPAVVVRHTLEKMGMNLHDVGADLCVRPGAHAGAPLQSPPNKPNPVFDDEEMKKITKAGMERLVAMQLRDGGWGWFSGYGESSSAHTTAVVMRGLRLAKECGMEVPEDVVKRGAEWLRRDQEKRVAWIAEDRERRKANAEDALTALTLASGKQMLDYLYEDRADLPFYAKAMLGLAFDATGDVERRDMMARNVMQFLKTDEENQTAYFELGNGGYWWHWYGSDIEAQAHGLMLLMRSKVEGGKVEAVPGLVKYIVNNRKNASYWNSTRDTALAIEALAQYMEKFEKTSSFVTRPSSVEIKIDGIRVHSTVLDGNQWQPTVFEMNDLADGEHTLEIARTGDGPLYYNVYLTNYTLEDPIAAAGLEIKVNRKIYKLLDVGKTGTAAGERGQSVAYKQEKFERVEIKEGDILTSGDLLEIELTIDSKNDYEYLIFEDMKAAGCEAVNVQSGYQQKGLHAYVEYRDNRASFFVRRLARGTHNVSYRLRAEIPGRFSALPAKGWAMYAPELRANSNEAKLSIED